jgi:hypothetical protein
MYFAFAAAFYLGWMHVVIQRGDARVRRRIYAQGGSSPFMNWLAEGVRGLSPAYFALVMATGIVSIAAGRAGFRTIAAVLLWLKNAGHSLNMLQRLLRHRR